MLDYYHSSRVIVIAMVTYLPTHHICSSETGRTVCAVTVALASALALYGMETLHYTTQVLDLT